MSARDESNTRVLAQATEITAEGLKIARGQWLKHNVMRQVLQIEADNLIERGRAELEHCPIEQIHEKRGILTGIRQMKAMIDSQGPI